MEDIADTLHRLAEHPGSTLLCQATPLLRRARAEILRLRKRCQHDGADAYSSSSSTPTSPEPSLFESGDDSTCSG